MKKMVLFVLLWQGYATASDSELRQLLAPHSSTSMSINDQEGIEVPLVNLNGDPSPSSLASLRAALKKQKENLKQSSSTGDCKRVTTALVIPGLCAAGGVMTAVMLAPQVSYYWLCSGALSGIVFSLTSVPLVAKGYDICVDQPAKDKMRQINEELRRINEPLEMREED